MNLDTYTKTHTLIICVVCLSSNLFNNLEEGKQTRVKCLSSSNNWPDENGPCLSINNREIFGALGSNRKQAVLSKKWFRWRLPSSEWNEHLQSTVPFFFNRLAAKQSSPQEIERSHYLKRRLSTSKRKNSVSESSASFLDCLQNRELSHSIATLMPWQNGRPNKGVFGWTYNEGWKRAATFSILFGRESRGSIPSHHPNQRLQKLRMHQLTGLQPTEWRTWHGISAST